MSLFSNFSSTPLFELSKPATGDSIDRGEYEDLESEGNTHEDVSDFDDDEEDEEEEEGKGKGLIIENIQVHQLPKIGASRLTKRTPSPYVVVNGFKNHPSLSFRTEYKKRVKDCKFQDTIRIAFNIGKMEKNNPDEGRISYFQPFAPLKFQVHVRHQYFSVINTNKLDYHIGTMRVNLKRFPSVEDQFDVIKHPFEDGKAGYISFTIRFVGFKRLKEILEIISPDEYPPQSQKKKKKKIRKIRASEDEFYEEEEGEEEEEEEEVGQRKEELEKEKIELKEKLEKLNESKNCCICYENEKCIVLLRCNHLCVCVECSEKIDKCPLCRRDIFQKLKVFV